MNTLEPQKVLVYGLGRSGMGVIRHLKKLGWSGAWFDAKPNPDGELEAVSHGFSRVTNLEPKDFDLVVAAPGVMVQNPDLEMLRGAGLPVIGEVELAYLTTSTPTIGVTGTAGKGSTTALIAHLLRSQNINALEGGNFDPPLLEIVDTCKVAVTELSSFQLERIDTYRPSVAVITNLGVDHITDHGSLERYHAAKWRIAQNLMPQDSLVFPTSVQLGRETQANVMRVLETGDVLDLAGKTLLEISKLPVGIHPMNARLAVTATLLYLERIQKHVNIEVVQKALLEFKGVSGRFETIAIIDNTRFIEDSIATRTLAVQAALENAPAPIAWILGGRDKLGLIEKQSELPKMLELVKHKVAVILAFGESGMIYAEYFKDTGVKIVDLSLEKDGEKALEKAVNIGSDLAHGGSVLLAPLGTSFDLFANYKARGAAFKAAVLRLELRTPQPNRGAP
jgi:UDP-N-acetylmuramoylalanine--D-glutamate ligase